MAKLYTFARKVMQRLCWINLPTWGCQRSCNQHWCYAVS